MWVIFVLSAIAIAIISMCLFWIGNKFYIDMKRDNYKFEKEMKNEKETNEDE